MFNNTPLFKKSNLIKSFNSEHRETERVTTTTPNLTEFILKITIIKNPRLLDEQAATDEAIKYL